MTCKGRSQWFPDEIHPQRERCAAWQGKLSNEVSAITWKCGFEIYQFGHLQTIYTYDEVILAAAQYLISWKNLYKQVWMMALQDRDGAELNVLGRQPHASWLSHCLHLNVQNHQSKLILWNLLLKENQGALDYYVANSFKNMYLLTKIPCSQGKVSKILSTGPKQLLQELAQKCFQFSGSTTHPKLWLLDIPT